LGWRGVCFPPVGVRRSRSTCRARAPFCGARAHVHANVASRTCAGFCRATVDRVRDKRFRELPRRARSRAEFIAKIGLVAEEADESEHWLDVLEESGTASGPELDSLRQESRELRAIFVASATTARKNHRRL